MLGIDVLEADGFRAIRGKRIGLLTHPAAVNRQGISTIEVLRRAPEVKLVALFGPEHGVAGDAPGATAVDDAIDARTGLPAYSLYGATKRPTKAMLRGIDALVIDLQDIGTRSYTFTSCMKWAMEGCFENGVEVIVLDRPNPLGGLKVSGPMLDSALVDMKARPNNVGAFAVPYVHGLTIGELARLAKDAQPPNPNALEISARARSRGKLTVIPMRGWTRAMRWPETGLTWIPTSPLMADFSAVMGYPMVGLGTFFDLPRFDIGFRHGVGKSYPFRGLSSKAVGADRLRQELATLAPSGLRFQIGTAADREGRPATGVLVEVTDYDRWDPTELNFVLMKLACRFEPKNPFAPIAGRDFSGFLHHLGSAEFLYALQRDGARLALDPWLAKWRQQARAFQLQSRTYWLYPR